MVTATAAEPRGRHLAFDGHLRTVLVAVGIVLLELAIGVGMASGHARYAELLVFGTIFFAVVWRFPLAAGCAGLFLAAGIIYPQYFVFHVGPRSVYGYEAILVVLLLRAGIRPRRRTWGGVTGGALLLFLAVLLLSTYLAISAGTVSVSDATNWGRPFLALSIFWVVIRLYPDRGALGRLLSAGIVIGAISGVVGVALAVSGNLHSVFQDSGNQLLSQGTIGSLLRVRMPGLPLAFMLVWLVLLWLARGHRPRWLWWLCLPGMLLSIAVSQNRNMWLFGVLALLLVLTLAGGRTRQRLVFALAVVGVGIGIAIAVPQGGNGGPAPLNPLVQRASTLLSPQEISQSNSARDRGRELQAGWSVAKRNLLIGIGPGVPYGLMAVGNLGNGLHTIGPQLFLHNQYLYILLITGIPGLLSFLVFVLSSVVRAFAGGVVREARVLGIGVIALLLTGAVMLSLSDPSYLTALGMVAGVIFCLASERSARAPAPAPALP